MIGGAGGEIWCIVALQHSQFLHSLQPSPGQSAAVELIGAETGTRTQQPGGAPMHSRFPGVVVDSIYDISTFTSSYNCIPFRLPYSYVLNVVCVCSGSEVCVCVSESG